MSFEYLLEIFGGTGAVVLNLALVYGDFIKPMNLN